MAWKTLKSAVIFFFASDAFGLNAEEFPTLSLSGYGGYSVYKSEMVQSNDTTFVLGYGVEIFAGRSHEFGMAFNRESAQIPFALNNAKISINSDTYLWTYSFGPIWFGPLFNYSLWEVDAPTDADANEFLDQDTPSESYLTASSQGIGAHGGFDFYLGKKTLVHLKFASSSSTQSLQETPAETSAAGVTGTAPDPARKISFGQRTDIDLGASLLLSREVLKLIFGFKASTYQIKIQEKAFNETHNTTYLGLLGAWYF